MAGLDVRRQRRHIRQPLRRSTGHVPGLYSSTQRLATFVECLSYFRPDPRVFAEYDEISGEPGDDDSPGPGVVPREWIAVRCIGTGVLHGDYVDVGHHETIAELRTALAPHAVHHGVHDIDAAALRLSVPRAFTQEISRYVFGQSTGGGREWNGLAYRSRHGDDLTELGHLRACLPAWSGGDDLPERRPRPRRRLGTSRSRPCLRLNEEMLEGFFGAMHVAASSPVSGA